MAYFLSLLNTSIAIGNELKFLSWHPSPLTGYFPVDILHSSYSSGSVDGGIAAAVTGLVGAQEQYGLHPHWITSDSYAAIMRDYLLKKSVLANSSSILHIHGLWRSPTRVAASLAGTCLPYVVAPHGMLHPRALAHSRWKKSFVWHLWERKALALAGCLHALCHEEASLIREVLPSIPIAVIPNGITIPENDLNFLSGPCSTLPPWHSLIPVDEKILLFLGRFHDGKGISPLLRAWQSVVSQAERNGWWLALVGYGDGGELKDLLSKSPVPRCLVLEPVFGKAKLATLGSASAFVLPSFFEAQPMAALEAMSFRLPCLLSTSCNLPLAFECNAALKAEPNVQSLSQALQALFELSPDQLVSMGVSAQRLVDYHYSWPNIAGQTLDLYQWLLGGGDKPPFVL